MSRACVFCDIIKGKAPEPKDFIRHGDVTVSFEPLNPHAPGHRIFLPVIHVKDAVKGPASAGHAFTSAMVYASKLKACNIITSVGEAATQSVFHLHVHVVPRGDEDMLEKRWPWIGQLV